MELKIDPEFQKQIPPLRDEEKAMLESQMKKDGCTHPLAVWGMTIVDGHNRYEICKKHDIPYDINSMDFPDREAALDWIDRNQVAGRNLTKDDFRLIVGRIYNRTKKAHGGDRKSSGQNDHLNHGKAAEAIAKDFDVSPVSVRRHGKFAEAVDTIQQQQPEIERGAAIETAKEMTRTNKPKPAIATPRKTGVPPDFYEKASMAMKYAEMAISQLERINKQDPKKKGALLHVKQWIETQTKESQNE